MLSLNAGKVHGSLARAGKVRGQTPKVQKQDKKKQPKGRAMKRIKYNRRFVNVGERTGLCVHPAQLTARAEGCICRLYAFQLLVPQARLIGEDGQTLGRQNVLASCFMFG